MNRGVLTQREIKFGAEVPATTIACPFSERLCSFWGDADIVLLESMAKMTEIKRWS